MLSCTTISFAQMSLLVVFLIFYTALYNQPTGFPLPPTCIIISWFSKVEINASTFSILQEAMEIVGA